LTDFGLATFVRGINSVLTTQTKGYTAAWAAPEILQGGDEITREGDIFALGMVVIEVGPRVFPHLASQLVGSIFYLMSKSCFRSSQGDFHSAISNPTPSF